MLSNVEARSPMVSFDVAAEAAAESQAAEAAAEPGCPCWFFSSIEGWFAKILKCLLVVIAIAVIMCGFFPWGPIGIVFCMVCEPPWMVALVTAREAGQSLQQVKIDICYLFLSIGSVINIALFLWFCLEKYEDKDWILFSAGKKYNSLGSWLHTLLDNDSLGPSFFGIGGWAIGTGIMASISSAVVVKFGEGSTMDSNVIWMQLSFFGVDLKEKGNSEAWAHTLVASVFGVVAYLARKRLTNPSYEAQCSKNAMPSTCVLQTFDFTEAVSVFVPNVIAIWTTVKVLAKLILKYDASFQGTDETGMEAGGTPRAVQATLTNEEVLAVRSMLLRDLPRSEL